MNQNAHHGMNGFRPNNGASTSSHNFQEYSSPISNQPIFNNNMPQQPSQRRPSNQWPQPMPMNIQPSQMPSQTQPPFNQQPWGNQTHPLPAFANGMPPMGPFNMPFLPQQILQDAFALSIPVEGTDEPTLMARLIECQKRKESYKDALNSLHGKNGHSASLWKDYYLDHKERLDNWVKMCLLKEQSQSLIPTVKKPSPAFLKRESPPTATRVSTSAPIKKSRKTNQPTPPVQNDQSGSRRNTINSLTAPAPIFGNRLPPPNADVKVPEPPSRSPSPPTRIIPHRGRGNKYTQEDRDFFIKFIGWRLKHDNSLTRHDLCDLLAEKAPHHTAQSWASHWSNNHDVPDKILAAARGEDYVSDGSESSGEETMTVRRRPKYKEHSTSEEELDNSDSDANEEEDDDDDDNDDTPLRIWTEEEMGQKGEPFTEADLYFTAKYIASFPDWNTASSKDRWSPYSEKYPQRSAKSWTEYYRRYERALDKIIKKIRQEGRQGSQVQFSASPLPDQCARPTRPPPKVKRKFDIEGDDLSVRKRGRADED